MTDNFLPFRLGTTSYILPADILPNVEYLAGRVEDIDPEACRSAARTRFTAERMASEYFELYRRVANREARRSVA